MGLLPGGAESDLVQHSRNERNAKGGLEVNRESEDLESSNASPLLWDDHSDAVIPASEAQREMGWRRRPVVANGLNHVPLCLLEIGLCFTRSKELMSGAL